MFKGKKEQTKGPPNMGKITMGQLGQKPGGLGKLPIPGGLKLGGLPLGAPKPKIEEPQVEEEVKEPPQVEEAKVEQIAAKPASTFGEYQFSAQKEKVVIPDPVEEEKVEEMKQAE